MFLSIVIPAYNEAGKIVKDIHNVLSFFEKNSIDGELIIVDDGSTDDTSGIVKKEAENLDKNILLLRKESNHGKGAAVKEGIIKSSGKYILYADAGSVVPFENFFTALNLIQKEKYDICSASRKLPGSKIVADQDWDRKIIAKLFLLAAKTFLGIPHYFTDTQCGFKVYSADAAKKLYPQIKTNGFLFELEIILLALKFGYKIKEFPVEWRCDRDSRLSINKSGLPILKDFMTILRKY